MKIAVTGANGYIGSAVVAKLLLSNNKVVAFVRKKTTNLPDKAEQIIIGDMSEIDSFKELEIIFKSINGFDALIHTAGLAHNYKNHTNYLAMVNQVNVEATIYMAKLAEKFNVRRFIFMSSVGVNGNISKSPFTENDMPNPHNYYAKCKYEAEQRLLLLAENAKIEIVIVRAPLVYSFHAPGNFSRLVKIIKSGYPLPFSGVQNKRSILALDNLVDFLIFCSDKESTPLAKNQIFLIADNDDISTKELIEKVSLSLNKKARLISIKPIILFIFFKIIRKSRLYDQLCDNLQMDISKARSLLNWSPKATIDTQLNKKKLYKYEKII